MTLYVERVSDRIAVKGTSGGMSISVVEGVGHLRSFWGQLGALLEELEKDISDRAAGEVASSGAAP
jgi:hypothetical protein